jgi:hypothetical protein
LLKKTKQGASPALKYQVVCQSPSGILLSEVAAIDRAAGCSSLRLGPQPLAQQNFVCANLPADKLLVPKKDQFVIRVVVHCTIIGQQRQRPRGTCNSHRKTY